MNGVARKRVGRREVAARLAVVVLVLVVMVTAAVDMDPVELGADGRSTGCALHVNPGCIVLSAIPVVVAAARALVPAESSGSPSRPGSEIFVPPRA
jgi:hypothetical protein